LVPDAQLILELKPLRKFCKGHNPNGKLLILISGNRPPPSQFKEYPDFIYFDEDLLHIYNTDELKKVGQVSLQYSRYAKWKGKGAIPVSDDQRLKHVIDSVHALGKQIRFWDAPDTKAGWTQLIKLHADIIGTDHIDELSAFKTVLKRVTRPRVFTLVIKYYCLYISKSHNST
jgi:hypothetical protein